MTTTRIGGYAALGDYGVLGDGHAGALVATDGAVDWFAAPRLDAPPLCAALLDPAEGGAITLAPTVPYESSQRYLSDTMVLQTTFRCESGEVQVTDALTLGSGGPLPWTELARRIEAVSGEVPMRWQVRPGHRLGTGRPWGRWRDDVPVLEAGPVQLAVVADGVGTPVLDSGTVAAEFTAHAGERALIAVVANSAEPLPRPTAADVQGRVDHTVDFWRRWCADVDYDGPYMEAVRRSALTLKALTLSPYDGIASALTTSLPERVGGQRNFDYRFGWVRDASFSLDAMSRLRLTEEVHGALSWLLRAVSRTAPEVRALYTLDGAPASDEMAAIDSLPGYRDSPPVHIGNAAASQLQLGAYGDLMDAVWRYTEHGGYLDASSAAVLTGITDRTCEVWRSEDAGIWELGNLAHYTISKIGCWVALDRAVRLAEAGQLSTPHVARWRCERDAVHAWVDERCWSATKQSYTFYAGTDELDAAVLLAARTGFLSGDDPRLRSTIAAVQTELTAGGPLLYRYTGMRDEEGAFLACTFWLVEALALAGQRAEAQKVLDQALDYSGETGLYSEEVDPASGELRGNLPQGLTHLALIGAATTVRSR
ncbi:MAG TPA: glycoside hydrolase family 15 protein [Nocardioidaceae bacterium]|nr:glycoside hydrolase family 15 protein [Nocardioidaceae bacterium]